MKSYDERMSRTLRRLYWRERLSIRQISSAIGMSYEGTRQRLREIGPIRSSSEGRMKYRRRPFTGNERERAYLLGLRAGDINAWRKSRNTVEVRVSTTHPAMSRLFSKAFERYGHLMLSAEPAYLPGHFRWQSRAHLDTSFEFLVTKPRQVPDENEGFFPFLGGYSDSESSWVAYPQRGRIRISWVVETYDGHLIRQISSRLKANGFHPLLYRTEEQERFGSKNQRPSHGKRFKFRLALSRTDEVVTLAERLMPFSMHAEKIARMRLILARPKGAWSEIAIKVRDLRQRIRNEVTKYKGKAERAYYNTPRRNRFLMGSSARPSNLGASLV
jgi:hypothetical protein